MHFSFFLLTFDSLCQSCERRCGKSIFVVVFFIAWSLLIAHGFSLTSDGAIQYFLVWFLTLPVPFALFSALTIYAVRSQLRGGTE
jgi:hypothetical protein